MMKVLVCIPHFFGRTEGTNTSQLGSASAAADERASIFGQAIRGLSSLFLNRINLGTTGQVSEGIGMICNDHAEVMETSLTGDIYVVTSGSSHLFDRVSSGAVAKQISSRRTPTHLGYSCLEMFAASVEAYDLFMFIEDDILIHDDKFFQKMASFYEQFGEDVILSPNRYEFWGRKDVAWKVYIEGDAPPSMRVPHQATWRTDLSLSTNYGSATLSIARNPMSACFVITRNQVKRWMEWPDFQRPDPVMQSTMLVLEAVQLPLAGRLPIYKPVQPNASFLEVHHLPNRLSGMKTPSQKIRKIAGENIASRAKTRS